MSETTNVVPVDAETSEAQAGEVVLAETEEAPAVVTPIETEVVPDLEIKTQEEPAPDDEPALAKARKEAANYRTKLRASETANVALRDQLIKIHLGPNGVTTAALEAAGIDLGTLVGEDGTVSPDAVAQAAQTARETLGIPNHRFQGTADQGNAGRQSPPANQPTWGNLLNPQKPR